MPADNHKTQRKEAKDEGVFLGFGDDGAVNTELEVVRRSSEKSAGVANQRVAVGSRSEVADGFGQQAGAIPRGSGGPGAVVSKGGADARADSVVGSVQKHVGDGWGVGCDGYCRRIRSVGGKGDVRSASARYSFHYRIDVCGIAAGEQGREGEDLVVGRVGAEGIGGEAYGVLLIEGVAGRGSKGACAVGGNAEDDDGSAGCGGSAKNPDGLVGVVLAGIDVDVELGLGLLQRSQGKQGDG